MSCTSAPALARLEIDDQATAAALIARCNALDVDRGGPRQIVRIVFWSAAAIASIIAIVIYGIPVLADQLAPLVPRSAEQQMGRAVDMQVRAIFGDKVCEAPEGKAAFAKMIEKLRAAGGIEQPLDAHVLPEQDPERHRPAGRQDLPVRCAPAKGRNPDEIAGVLAHELGHGQHRHHMRSLIHNGGTSFVIGLLLGDITGGSAVIFATRQLLQASHSREAEQEADEYATMVMRKLGRSPVPLAELLLRITGEQGKQLGGVTILNSHPLTEYRLALAKKNDGPNTGPEIFRRPSGRRSRRSARGRAASVSP